jgi:asparagine synthase (glutamine-hydrolysing)
MCGIAGMLSTEIQKTSDQTLSSMRSSILYRGRDEQDEWSDHQNIHLLHSRLSIIDLTTGHQPMWDVSERYVIVYNGEIYNYLELRKEYGKNGAIFETQSDTEVILEGFKQKGKHVCRDLNGMFAFAIWDTQEKVLFLARDHLGKKPLFWCYLNDTFYFSSTIDSFRSVPGWEDRISIESLQLYEELAGFPEDSTIYTHAHAVPSASCGLIRLGEKKLVCERYWRMDFHIKSNASFNDLIDEYEDILTDAIRIRLRSDVPLALTFSGGVDSGTIAAICAQRLKTPLKCYTIDYHTPEDQSIEALTAQDVAKILGLDWEFIQFEYQTDLLKDLSKSYVNYDQPCVQLALVYSQRLYEMIKPSATVVLSGNGADELFTGYIGDENLRQSDIKLNALRKRKHLLNIANSNLVRKIFSFSGSGKIRQMYRKLQQMQAELNYAENWLHKDISKPHSSMDLKDNMMSKMANERRLCGVNFHLDYAMYQNLTCSTMDSNFRLPDISGLAAQVEVRSPFLDYRMVEFAARLPHQYKVGDVRTPTLNKYLPKKYYERLVGKDIARMGKRGMGYNLRWDKSIVHDSKFKTAFKQAYLTIEKAGIDANTYRDSWQSYMQEKSNGAEFPASADRMMAGFMLGKWLSRIHQ